MKTELVKLADYFDSIDHDGLANYIDGILKISQMSEDGNYTVPSRRGRTEEAPAMPDKRNFISFRKDSGDIVKIFIDDNRLLRAIKDVIYKLFMLEDTQVTESDPVTREELENIYSESIKYDQNFDYYQKHEDNPAALTPNQFAEITSDIYRTVSYEYKGDVRSSEVSQDVREFLITQYNQVYLEDYLGRDPRLEDYSTSEKQERSFKPRILDPSELIALDKKNNKHVQRMKEEDTMKRMYPDWAKQQRRLSEENTRWELADKGQPEEWLDVLLEPKD